MANGYTGDNRIRPLEKLLMDFAAPRGYDLDMVFTGLLDYILWVLDPEGKPIENWRFKMGEGAAFREMFCCLCEILSDEIEHHGWYDAFGDLFMSLHQSGNGKGQFFTPECISSMMAKLTIENRTMSDSHTPFGNRIVLNDPTAGSSRLLLAAAVELMRKRRDEGMDEAVNYARRPYLVCEDIDYNCVKISAINIALHGYFGEAVCHNTLTEPDQVRLGYIVNETMYPFPNKVPSIRKVQDPRRFVATSIWARLRR